ATVAELEERLVGEERVVVAGGQPVGECLRQIVGHRQPGNVVVLPVEGLIQQEQTRGGFTIDAIGDSGSACRLAYEAGEVPSFGDETVDAAGVRVVPGDLYVLGGLKSEIP